MSADARSAAGSRYAPVLALAVVVAPASGWTDETAKAPADLAHGRKLAIAHCALCHVVGDFNKYGGIGSTPSFRVLASMRDDPERFRTFFARPPHPSFVKLADAPYPTDYPLNAPPVELEQEDVRDIAAFAATLKDPSW